MKDKSIFPFYLYNWLESPANFRHIQLKDRTRCYATIVYPNNKGNEDIGLSPTPDNWIDILRSFNVPCFISPLHDQDHDPSDDHEKKPHYHVMIMFDGVKTIRQFDAIRNAIGGVGYYIIDSISGYARYLCHLDHPHKHQYPTSGVTSLCGADYESCIGDLYNRKNCIIQMQDFIDRTGCVSFSQLARFARKYEYDWYSCLMDNSFFIREYIRGCYLERQAEVAMPSDEEIKRYYKK